jgi:hypothetical protein
MKKLTPVLHPGHHSFRHLLVAAEGRNSGRSSVLLSDVKFGKQNTMFISDEPQSHSRGE